MITLSDTTDGKEQLALHLESTAFDNKVEAILIAVHLSGYARLFKAHQQSFRISRTLSDYEKRCHDCQPQHLPAIELMDGRFCNCMYCRI